MKELFLIVLLVAIVAGGAYLILSLKEKPSIAPKIGAPGIPSAPLKAEVNSSLGGH